MSTKITLDEFIERSSKHHGDNYDYSNVVYVDAQTKVQIRCKKHNHIFWQRPVTHSSGGYGCPECVAEVKRKYFQHSKELAMSKLPPDVLGKYDFSGAEYNGYHSKVIIRCRKHNIYFGVVWMCLYQNSGCPECSKENARKLYSKTTAEFIQEAREIFGDVYDYNKVEYINGKEKVIISCKKHGDFLKMPQKHLLGQGCPKCKSSKGETAILKVLDKHGIHYIREWSTPECKDTILLRFDFRVDLLDKFFLVEYDGKQHFEQNPDWAKDKHSQLKNVKRRDGIKNTYCRNNNIPLLRIPYWDFPNIEDIITAFIKEQQNGQTEQETT